MCFTITVTILLESSEDRVPATQGRRSHRVCTPTSTSPWLTSAPEVPVSLLHVTCPDGQSGLQLLWARLQNQGLCILAGGSQPAGAEAVGPVGRYQQHLLQITLHLILYL